MVRLTYRDDIQVLRGLAVLMVIGFHAAETYIPLGYLGVDIFFVISGYVITPIVIKYFSHSSAQSREKRAFKCFILFLENRFWRLFPALITSLILAAILVLLFAPISDHERFSKQGLFTLIGIGNIGAYLFNGDYFSSNPNPLIHLWSLSVEAQIYILIPIILLLTIKFGGNLEKRLYIIYVLLSVFSFLSLMNPNVLAPMFSLLGIDRFAQFTFYSTSSRIWQFGIGGLLYLCEKRQKKLSSTKSLCALSLVLICLTLAGIFELDYSRNSFVATFLSALVIHTSALEETHRTLKRPLIWIGYRSYSIYLLHMPIFYTIQFSPVMHENYINNTLIWSLSGIFLSIICGSINFTFIESRFRNNSRFELLLNRRMLVSMLFLSAPLILGTMIVGAKNHYWGLEIDRKTQIQFAAEIDQLCDGQTSLGSPCDYSITDSRRTLLLIGDSYATQISQIVIDTGNFLGWNVFVTTHGNCPIQFTDPQETLTNECLKDNLATLKWIQEHRPNSLIVSNRIRPEHDMKSIEDAVDILRRYTKNIIVVGNTPEFPDSDKFMVRRPLFLQLTGAYMPPKRFKVEEMNSGSRSLSDKFLNHMRDLGLDVIDLWGYFCDETYCRRYGESGWLYFEANHLSVSGANLLGPLLSEQITRW